MALMSPLMYTCIRVVQDLLTVLLYNWPTVTKKMAACTFYQNVLKASRQITINTYDTKSPNDEKFEHNEKFNLVPYGCPSERRPLVFLNDLTVSDHIVLW